mmetsp:Transcript_16574/g.47271  ORF Transcript_16574/g.47271 Transcript_16574/m.47271 type:complete len:217 (+) Transcript_16574:2236-2886(+)
MQKRHSSASNLLSPIIILIVIRKEKRSLWASKRLRHTFVYTKYVKKTFRFSNLCSMSFDAGALPTPVAKRALNQGSAYWYIGSTLAMSARQKYNRLARLATGRYSSDVLLTSTAVTSASCMRMFTSFDVFFACASVSIKFVSSRMLPFDSASSFKILDSISNSCLFMAADWTTSSLFFSASSGISSSTVAPSSCSSSPDCVTVKFTRLILTCTSGL